MALVKNNLLLLACVLLLALPSAMAKFDMDITPITDTITPIEMAKFKITVLNYEDTDDRYVVYTLDTNWIIDPAAVTVDASKEKDFTLTVRPIEGVLTGAYQIPITLRSTRGTTEGLTVTKNLFVFLKPEHPVQVNYAPNVGVDVSFPENFDPRNKLPIELTIKNRNPVGITNLTLSVQSMFFAKDFPVELSAFEEKVYGVSFQIDPVQVPGDFKMNVILSQGNDTITQVMKPFTVLGYSTLKQEKETSAEFLKTTTLYTITNDGNIEKKQTIRMQIPFLQRLFTNSEPASVSVKENGIRSWTWNVDLQPQESTNIKLTTSYRGLVITIIIIILAIIGYFIFRSPVLSLKRAKLFDKGFEGTSEMKIKLFIKNRTSKPVFNIRIIDTIPHIAEVVEEESLGTIKPTKIIKQEKHGTIIRWEVEKLDPYEERIITYKAHAILKIVGNIHLPAFRTKFEAKLGSERVIKSNSVELLNEAPAEVVEAK